MTDSVPPSDSQQLAAERPWMNSALPAQDRAQLLVQAMSLTECIAQLQQTPLNQITDAALRSGLGSVILAGSATAGNVDGEAGNGFSGPEMTYCDRRKPPGTSVYYRPRYYSRSLYDFPYSAWPSRRLGC